MDFLYESVERFGLGGRRWHAASATLGLEGGEVVAQGTAWKHEHGRNVLGSSCAGTIPAEEVSKRLSITRRGNGAPNGSATGRTEQDQTTRARQCQLDARAKPSSPSLSGDPSDGDLGDLHMKLHYTR